MSQIRQSGAVSGDGAIWVSRRNLVQDLTRRYVVFIDGDDVGRLSAYRTAKFEVSPGWHRVWARLPGTGGAAVGDVVVNVRPGEVRRVRTTTRLKRLPPWEFAKALADTVAPYSPTHFRFAVEFSPRVLLRAWSPSELDADPPPSVGLPPSVVAMPGGVDSTAQALAEWVRNAAFASQSAGYSPRDVDRCLEAVATALDGGSAVDPAELTADGFSKARLGYERAAVDRFLAELRTRLIGRGTGAPGSA